MSDVCETPICQSEDQGGHPGCHRPATFQSKDVVSFTRPAGDKRMYFCSFHRERFYRLEDTEPMPPSAALVTALEANADFERAELDRYATLHFEQDTRYRERLEKVLGLKKTNWWKPVLDAAESQLASARQLAFPGTHTERGPEDDDEVCDVCSHSAEAGKHTYKDCVANFESVNAQVNGYLSDENEKPNAELASARAQVELTEAERRVVDMAMLFRELDASNREDALCRACDELLALRAREKTNG